MKFQVIYVILKNINRDLNSLELSRNIREMVSPPQ